VFRRLDYAIWRATAHNPVRMLWVVPAATLEAAARDPEFLRLYDRAIEGLEAARSARNTWWFRTVPHAGGQSIAYFSAEFALHQSLPIYAGGLGVLAGDHCKEASDLGVPLIGVGFMYPQGYFHQHVSAEGWQEESYEALNWTDAPIEPATTADGKRSVGPGRRVASPARARQVVPAGHESRGERAVGSRAVGPALRRGS
jgi:starch phosphorylase